jgi:hypothetical protein
MTDLVNDLEMIDECGQLGLLMARLFQLAYEDVLSICLVFHSMPPRGLSSMCSE